MIEYRRVGTNPTLETRSESYEIVDKNKRYKQIIEILYGGKEMTAREIAEEMFNRGYTHERERNSSAPRLTELSYKGIVEPIGKKKCIYTGRPVSVYKLIENSTTIFDFI